MSCKRLKDRASHSSSGLPAKKKCLLTLRQETKTLTNLLSTSSEQSNGAQVNMLSNSSSAPEDSSDDVQEVIVAATSSFETAAPEVDERDQCPTSLSSLKLVQICDTLQNCDMDFKMDQWGQQKSPTAQQKIDQENREPNSRLSPSASKTTSVADRNKQYYQLQRHQRKKELGELKVLFKVETFSFPAICQKAAMGFFEVRSRTNARIEDVIRWTS